MISLYGFARIGNLALGRECLLYALDLGEESGQQPKVLAGHPDQAGNHFRRYYFIRKRDADRLIRPPDSAHS